jgi:cold-inducible RNA-binding protein
MRDRDTGRSRGFGFVTYSKAEEADAAIQNLSDQTVDGRRIKVNMANAKPSGGGGGGANLTSHSVSTLITVISGGGNYSTGAVPMYGGYPASGGYAYQGGYGQGAYPQPGYGAGKRHSEI